MLGIHWSPVGRENFVAPGGGLEGLSFAMRDETPPPADLPFSVIARGGGGCLWSRWMLEASVPVTERPVGHIELVDQ